MVVGPSAAWSPFSVRHGDVGCGARPCCFGRTAFCGLVISATLMLR
jgi:hypothetical protein